MTAILLKEKPKVQLPVLNLSVSKIKTFDQDSGGCRKKYKYGYIEKLPKKEFEHLSFGKYLHEVLERYHKALLENPDQNYKELLSECQDKALEVWGEKLSLESKTEAYDILQKYLRKFLKEKEEEYKNLSPNIISLEKNFWILIDDKVLLNGFIDVLAQDHDETYIVADYKSSQKKSIKYLRKDFFQLLVYAFALHLMYPGIQKAKGRYILLRNDFESIDAEFSLKQIQSVESKILSYAEEIEKEKLFRANPTPLCSWCDWSDICSEKWVNPKDSKKQKDKVKSKSGETDW